jgi:predicted transposase/invertase (TIGR01784 family)
MTSSVIHQPHDKFIKLSLGEPRVAQEFFTEHLPPTVLEKMNLTTLKLENKSFIDDHFKNSEADVIYSVQVAQATAYLYLLCEHQSTVDPLMAFRLEVYRMRLMELHVKQNPGQPLPLVYPLVIYTGKAPWNAPLNIFELFGNQQTLAEEWFFKPFQLLNIHQLKDEDIRRRQWSGLVEYALKYKQVRDFKQFLKILLPWIQEIEKNGSSGFSLSKTVLKYTLDGVEGQDFDFFKKSIREYLSPTLGDEIMTLAQELQQKGEATVITRQLKHRFHDVPESYLTRIKQADEETLLSWSDKILDAQSLEEIFE